VPALTQGIASAELALSELTVPAPVQVAAPDPMPLAPEPFELEDEMVTEEAELEVETSSEPVIDMFALEQALEVSDAVLDMTAIEQRYPLLRNAL
jgi:hypothetical protein